MNNNKNMANKIRIKLEIKLKNHKRGLLDGDFELIIKVIKKDSRFNVILKPDDSYSSLIYTATGGFQITTTTHTPQGWIGNDFFVIPNKKYLNRKITKNFVTDTQRKSYLNQLYISLMAWAEQWGEFSKEPTVRFRTLSNKWYIYITK